MSRNLTLIGLICAVSMTTIDQTIVALSAPTIQSELHLDHVGIQWAVNAYLLAAAGCLVVGGRLSDLFGHRRLVLIGIAGFAGTSLLCGLTPSGVGATAWLVTARALQGASGAVLVPAAVGIVVQSYDVARRACAMAAFFAITGSMTAIGPIAGGALTEWTWRAIFWVNIPIAVVAFGLVVVSATRSSRVGGRIDVPGAVLVAAGMTLLILGLEQSAEWGWRSALLWAVLAAGVAALVAFVAVERKAADPLVRVAAFRDRGFSIAILSTLVASIAFVPAFFFLSVYGQVSLRLSVLTTGLLFLKFFFGFVLASRFGSARFDRSGARPVLLIGGVLGAVGFGVLATQVPRLGFDGGAFFNAQTPAIVLAGAGIGFLYTPMSADAVNRAVGASFGEVTALSQSARSFGGALGLAVLGPAVAGRFADWLSASFGALGLPTSAAQQAITGAAGSGGRAAVLRSLPPELAERIRTTVAHDYADAVQTAFVGMAIAMGVLVVLGLLSPARAGAANTDRPRIGPAIDPDLEREVQR